jgi:hypothetical protein
MAQCDAKHVEDLRRIACQWVKSKSVPLPLPILSLQQEVFAVLKVRRLMMMTRQSITRVRPLYVHRAGVTAAQRAAAIVVILVDRPSTLQVMMLL